MARSPFVYVESPLERIVDYHAGGLAVHFGDGAGPPVEPPPETHSRRRMIKRQRADELSEAV
jgi:hypothetical protein